MARLLRVLKVHRYHLQSITAKGTLLNVCMQRRIVCYQNMDHHDFVFDDEDGLSTFLTLSEQGKQEFNKTYKARVIY